MSFIYTRADLKERINAGIHGKIGVLINENETVNRAVRQYNTDVDARSSRRLTALVPNLYHGVFDYNCPADLDAYKIIDIPPQAKINQEDFYIVPTVTFQAKHERGMIAIRDYNGVRALQIASGINAKSIVFSELDSFESGGGLWELFGDAQFLGDDDADYIKGNGSLTFDINASGGTTAGIFNSGLNSSDLTDFLGGTSSLFVWAKITSTTGLTNYKVRLGSDTSNYYTLTTTTQADGTAFVVGWNLLKWNLDYSVISETGAVDETSITYAAIYMTKLGSKVSETDYKFDYLVAKKGEIHNVIYYSKYGWQSTTGAYKENSTEDDDVLVADKDEYEMIIEKGIELAAREVNEYDIAKESKALYKEMTDNYGMTNPSEVKLMTYEYYKF